jgi:hypothetical protein
MIRKTVLTACVLAGLATVTWAQLPRTPSPEGASLYILSPQNEDTVSGLLIVRFGLAGMGVAPAGVEKEDTGHHHLLIDMAELPPLDQPLPATDHIKHIGDGQTETAIELTPGQHTLQLMLGDMNHVPHEPPVISERITIMVE